eukprot:1653486-Heterocapsa_arctica.AAC.1
MTHYVGANLLESRAAAEEYASFQESFDTGSARQQPAWDGERRQGSAPIRGAQSDPPVGPRTCATCGG